MKNRLDLIEEFSRRGYKHGAEIGVADGKFSLKLFQGIPDLHLICVDPWGRYPGYAQGGDQDQQDLKYKLALEKLSSYDPEIKRTTSFEAASQVVDGSLDFVFIDGNHTFDYVMADLIMWTPKVRKGGIVAGHDYYHFNNSGVIEAVTFYTMVHEIPLSIVGEVRKHQHDDDQPFYYWIK